MAVSTEVSSSTGCKFVPTTLRKVPVLFRLRREPRQVSFLPFPPSHDNGFLQFVSRWQYQPLFFIVWVLSWRIVPSALETPHSFLVLRNCHIVLAHELSLHCRVFPDRRIFLAASPAEKYFGQLLKSHELPLIIRQRAA